MRKLILAAFSFFIFLGAQAQNVGIGTNNPQTRLQVDGAISSTPSSVVASTSAFTIPDNVSIVLITDNSNAGANGNASVNNPQEGQYLTIYNNDAQTVSFSGYTIGASAGVISVVYVNGAWHLVSDNTGIPGPQGPAGPQGPQGNVGPQGPAGPQGNVGPQGPAGAQGPQGNVGPQGPAGAQGVQGSGYLATSTTSNVISNGSKTFTTQTGLAYLPNDRARISNSASNYVEGAVTSYSGTSLTINVDRFVGGGTFASWNIGVAGDIGADGAQGPQGNVGPQGPAGAQGPQGPAGAQGPQGNVGPQGPAGAQGPQGAQGPAGAQGPQGAVGPQGPAGSANINGTTNTIIKFTGATTGGNSNIFDVGGNIGIGTSAAGTLITRLNINGGWSSMRSDFNQAFSNIPAYMTDQSDAALFTGTTINGTLNGQSIGSEQRLYIEDDNNDAFGIWGNSCGGGGCFNLNNSLYVARFFGDGKIQMRTLASGANRLIQADANGVITTSSFDPSSVFTGSGSPDYTARWTSATNLSTGALRDNGTNVGIGTSPSVRLHILDGTPASVQGLDASTKIAVDAANGGFLEFRNTADNNTLEGVLFTDNNLGGYVAFRNAPDDVLHIGGYTAVAIETGTNNSVGGKAEVMRATSGGSVGIGVTNPAYKLEINGSFGYGNGTAGSYRSRTETRDDAGQQATQSGFFETSNPTPAADWYPGASSWQHLLDIRHSNNANNFAMQFAGSFFDQRFFARKTNNSASQAWSELVTAGNNSFYTMSANFSHSADDWCTGCGSTGQLDGADDATSVATMPFSVTINGTSYNQVSICSNGWVAFGNIGNIDFNNVALPASSFGANPVIFPYWDDLKDYGSGEIIRWGSVGTSPNQTFLIDYSMRSFNSSCTCPVHFQVLIHEGSGLINVKYRDTMDPNMNGQSATIGFQVNSSKAYPIIYNGKVLDDNRDDSEGWSVCPVR